MCFPFGHVTCVFPIIIAHTRMISIALWKCTSIEMSSSSKASPSKPLQENKDHPRFPYLQKNQSCGRNVHWMMNITFSFKSKLRLKGFTSQSKIVASSVIMMVTDITKFESHSCFVFTLNNILHVCLRELKLFDYSKYKAFSSPSMLDTIVSNNFS